MSIEDADIVDAVGVELATGSVVLTISDHLSWDEEESHIACLQEKLNAYLRFVESGELVDAYPDAKGRPVAIDIVSRVPVPLAGERFLEQARRTLCNAGCELRSRMLIEN